MHPAIIIGIVRSLIVDVATGQIPRSTERISSFHMKMLLSGLCTLFNKVTVFSLSEVFCGPQICQKCVCGRGSAPDPAEGAHDAPPDAPVGCGGGHPFPNPLSVQRLDYRVFGA